MHTKNVQKKSEQLLQTSARLQNRMVLSKQNDRNKDNFHFGVNAKTFYFDRIH